MRPCWSQSGGNPDWTCTYCGRNGHLAASCYDDPANKGKGGKNKGKNKHRVQQASVPPYDIGLGRCNRDLIGGLLGGVLSETPATSGLTRLMSRSMLKGTAKRTAPVIASEIESAGGSIDTYNGNNSFGLSLDILSEDTALGQAVCHQAKRQSRAGWCV